MNTILIIISILVTVVYLAYTIKKFGVPHSISETYYLLKRENKKKSVLFPFWAYATAIPLMIAWLNMTEGKDYQFLSFFAPAGLMFVGAAAQFKEKLTDKVHYGGAAICLIAAVILVVIWGYLGLTLICFFAAVLIIYKYGKPIFWVEIAGLFAAFVASLLKVL